MAALIDRSEVARNLKRRILSQLSHGVRVRLLAPHGTQTQLFVHEKLIAQTPVGPKLAYLTRRL